MFETPGELVADRFEIERHIGSGGMGVVYRARDRKTDATAAIKVMRPCGGNAAQRFLREASILAELTHPNIVGYVAHGETADGGLYLAMEWLDGEDLATRLHVSCLSTAEALALARQAADALAVAHQRGIVHRDVKPSNLFLLEWRTDRIKLLDFGIARALDDATLTRTGAAIGSPLYMAPEQARGGDVDARADVFGLGAVLFHALTGRPPFPAPSLAEVITRLVSSEPAPRARALQPAVPPAVDELLGRMLAKDPERRLRDAAAVLEAIERCAAGGTTPTIALAETATVAPASTPAVAPSATVDELVARGHAAHKDGRWSDARAAFEAALAERDTPEIRAALGDALWWLGDTLGSLAQHEKAYAELRKAESPEAQSMAGMIAIGMAMSHRKILGNDVAAKGWIARAARLLGDEPGPMHGYLWVAQGLCTSDPSHARTHHQRALGLARAHGDIDLELIALAGLGGAKVMSGEVDEGLELIDEAMAGAVGGEYQRPDTVVIATCCMVNACNQIADTTRLVEWTRAADRFMTKFGSPLLFSECRSHYGSALVATGRWSEGERELASVRTAAPIETAYYALASARMADLRIRQGRLDEAERVLDEIRDRPHARPVAAAIEHAAGRHQIAASLLRRYIDAAGSNILEVAGALDLLVDVCLAAGERDSAAATVRRLGELSGMHKAKVVAAHAAFAEGRFAVATDDLARARSAVERTIDLFAAAMMPHEAARARLVLAKVLARENGDVAASEARSARSAFERLGATRDIAAASELLRTLGATS